MKIRRKKDGLVYEAFLVTRESSSDDWPDWVQNDAGGSWIIQSDGKLAFGYKDHEGLGRANDFYNDAYVIRDPALDYWTSAMDEMYLKEYYDVL